jgi:hypothetical protein
MGSFFNHRPPRVTPDGRGYQRDAATGEALADDRPLQLRVPDVIVKSVADEVDRFFRARDEPVCCTHRSARAVVDGVINCLGEEVWTLRAASQSGPGGGQQGGGGEVVALMQEVMWTEVEVMAKNLVEVVKRSAPAAVSAGGGAGGGGGGGRASAGAGTGAGPPPPPGGIPARVAALEEQVLAGVQSGALLIRIKALEEAVLGAAASGAMGARVAAMEAELAG